MIDPEEDAVTGAEDAVEVDDADLEQDAEDTEIEGEESEPEGEELEEPAPKRGETRMQRLANEAKREREARIAAESESKALRESRQSQSDNSGEKARIRAEKLALMDPTERRIFEQDEVIKRLEQGQQYTQFQLADNADASTYARKAATNPIYAKHQDWVESQLANERKQGRYPTREALLMLKIGYESLNAKPSKKLAAKKAEAAGRVNGVKVAATSARSDVRGDKGKDDSAAALRARILQREASGDM